MDIEAAPWIQGKAGEPEDTVASAGSHLRAKSSIDIQVEHGDLHPPSRRKNKTDKRDAYRIGLMISRFDRSELPEVSVPSEREEELQRLAAEQELTPYLMSVPGVGPNVVTAFLAYVGDGGRFATAGQVAAYAGLVPRVDCSGEAEIRGDIEVRESGASKIAVAGSLVVDAFQGWGQAEDQVCGSLESSSCDEIKVLWNRKHGTGGLTINIGVGGAEKTGGHRRHNGI
jgi:hypothetical protein